jgi:hypothetical protein
MWRSQAFFALAKFKTKLSREVGALTLKDIESDTKEQVRYLGIWWTFGTYYTVVMFEATSENEAMNLIWKRADRMGREMLVGLPSDASSPAVPA